ncbi:hypothetical protein SAMN05892883_4045 [Jatrophihabitans sp. GAS493]|uniref:hypothetical protein n=1 Tax=Jatrophihabitans sp. GAS493 TaxID=1907575 RepID=UPI000BB6FB2E|nr:hypothetical protein [Jatrophihabitans sp. GAS493]SOD74852.1 hypothetical protein SAMN05892883_4045 [Jatrophihabitans sp. GAS493]
METRTDVRTDLDFASSTLAVAAPGAGDGYWAGGPSAIQGGDAIYLAYRLRRPVNEGRGYANVVARSVDGVRFETLCTLTRDDLVCASLERPALVRRPDGGWRIYVSLSTPGSKHWWIDAFDAEDPADLADGQRVTAWPGDALTAVKDPVVIVDADGNWHAWICCHPLDEAGAEDRMTTRYASSIDGLTWTWGDVVLSPPRTGWDRRGRRVAAILPRADGSVTGFYDGRADASENWYERTSTLTGPSIGAALTASSAEIAESPHGRHTLRYASVVDLGDGTGRAYFEAASDDGSNQIRTQLISL